MRAVCLAEERLVLWDAFVASHPEGTIYHCSDWKRALERAYPHLQGHVLVLLDPDTDSILAGIPIYEVTSRLLGNRLVCVPYSTWCGPLTSDQDQLNRLFEEVQNLGSKLGAPRIEVRCRGMVRPPPGWKMQRSWMHHAIRLDRDRETVWNGLSLNSVRQMVRRAKRSGVSITAEHDEHAMKLFYAALVETRKRLGLPMLPYRYFSSLQETLPQDDRTIFVARRSGRILGAALTVTGHGICHLELTGEYPESRQTGAMQLLVWKAVKHALDAGFREFSFGRTGLDNVGLLRYKRGWNTEEEVLSTLSWERREDAATFPGMALARPFAQWVMRLTPRPVYKLLGSFIYRHWA